MKSIRLIIRLLTFCSGICLGHTTWIQDDAYAGQMEKNNNSFSRDLFLMDAYEKEDFNLQDGVDTIITNLDIRICFGENYEGYTETGTYVDTFQVANGDSIRILNLIVDPEIKTNNVRWMCAGDTIEGHTIAIPGVQLLFVDTLLSASGCDSIRFLSIAVLQACDTFAIFNLDSCEAYMSNGSHMDYSEFKPNFSEVMISNFTCIREGTGSLFRPFPQENKHSCTPGVNGTKAMCVSVTDTCTYVPGHPASVVAEVEFHQVHDQGVVTSLEFYSKAPLSYVWIDGDSGMNNYPQRYGIRILLNGIEVFRKEDIPTTLDWSRQKFSLVQMDPIDVSYSSVLSIEWFPYCPVGNGAVVSVWDLDEIQISVGCATFEGPLPVISGIIRTTDNEPIGDAVVYLSANEQFTEIDTLYSDHTGNFTSEPTFKAGTYFLKAHKNGSVLEGVTTFDLLEIHKHLLGLQPFTSVFQYIAADIDRNNLVNSLDLLELRKMLLGIYTILPENTSWRMGTVPSDYTGTDITVWKEVQAIEFNGIDSIDMDWIGIKVGDVSQY